MRLKLTALSLLLSSFVLTGCQALAPSPARDTTSVEQMQLELDKALAAREHQQTVEPPASVTAELLPALPIEQASAAQQERFDISVDAVGARDFFIGLIKGTDLNIVVPPELSGSLSLDLQNVTIDEVMQIVRDTYGYDYVQSGNLYRVLPNGMRTQIFKIDYLNVQRMGSSETQVSSGQVSSAGSSNNGSGSSNNSSSDDDNNDSGSDVQAVVGTRLKTKTDADFWSGLADTIKVIIGAGENRRVVVSPQSGMVIVHAMAGELRSVTEFLDKAELSLRRQVILEAKILEVQLSDGFQAGVNWSALTEVGNGKNIIFGTGLSNSERTIDPTTGGTTLGNTKLGTPTAISTGTGSVGGVFSAALNLKDFNGLIDLLSTQGNVQVLSSPRISTVNNQKAVIKVGTDEFFVTEISSDTTTNTSSTTSTDVELTPFFSGIALDVTPQISESGEVVLHIHPTVSEVKDQTKTVVGPTGNLVLPLALSSIRETDSIVRARNGQVVVIGGLMQNSSTDDNAKTPLLGDLPLLGNAFRQKRQSSVKSELIILLKPIVADDDAWQSSLEASKQRISEFQQVFKPGSFE